MWPFTKQKEDFKSNELEYIPSTSYSAIAVGAFSSSAIMAYPSPATWTPYEWKVEERQRYVICQSCFATTLTPRCEYCGRPVD